MLSEGWKKEQGMSPRCLFCPPAVALIWICAGACRPGSWRREKSYSVRRHQRSATVKLAAQESVHTIVATKQPKVISLQKWYFSSKNLLGIKMETRLAVYAYILSYRCFVQMDPAFWESETAIFWNRVAEWMNLKTTPLHFCVYSEFLYFLKRWCHQPTSRP